MFDDETAIFCQLQVGSRYRMVPQTRKQHHEDAMKTLFAATAAMITLAVPAFAEGDIAKGEKTFKKCKACHMIATPDGETIVKGGRTGPNLYGVVGRAAASTDFKYSKAMKAVGEGGLVWDEEQLMMFVANPRGYLKEMGTDGKTKMTFKLSKGGPDVAAYLATFSPAPDVEEEAAVEGEVESTEVEETATEETTVSE